MKNIKLLFICLGNICRSPAAHAVMEHLVEQEGLQDIIQIDSAVIGDWHVGQFCLTDGCVHAPQNAASA